MSDNTEDLVSKIVEANALENAGETERAIALYQEILELDRNGNYGDVAQQALYNLQQDPSEDSIGTAEISQQLNSKSSWWTRLSIKAKTSLLITGIAVASSIGISTTAYILANRIIERQIDRAELKVSNTIAEKVALLVRQHYGDLKIIANIGAIANPELRSSTSSLQKQAILENYVNAYGVYSSISAIDLSGNPIAHSSKEKIGNQRERSYFQETLKLDRPLISQPIVSENSDTAEIYLSAPIKDSQSARTIGVAVARMPVTVIADLISSTQDDRTTYLLDNQGQIFWSSSQSDRNLNSPEDSDFYQKLKLELARRDGQSSSQSQSQRRSILVGETKIGYLTTFLDLDARLIEDLPDLGWSTVLTADKNDIFAFQKGLLQVFIIGTIAVGSIVTVIARLIADRFTRPIVEAAEAVKQMGQGNLNVKLAVRGKDELADLNRNLNRMAEQIEDLLYTQEAETEKQRQEKELLQQGVMGLLLDVEGAQKGDLTVKAQMTDGAIGSIADAFNATLAKLRTLLQKVQTVSSQVEQLSLAGEDSVRQLSESAIGQTAEITQALSSIDAINQSVETVASYAQEAAKIARDGSIQAKEGDLAMDATVASIETIRNTVANTAKKVKQLAESSQEIAQIVEIISGISEKTNLLAFNASVEAARAGEHGEGFRIVAEEVRRLADRTTEATKDIQQLVTTIQQDTTSVLQGIETSTSEVVNGSELVRMTKANLQSLANTSRQIDEYLNYISTNTIDQSNTSRQVNQKISAIATLAQTNSTEAQNVVQSLRTLVSEAENLQLSVSQFKLET